LKNLLTERCILAILTESDIVDVLPLFTNDEVRKYLGGVQTAEKALVGLRESMREENSYSFTVRQKLSKVLLGITYVSPHHNLEDMEISYMFLPEHWGNGYARESIKALLGFCKNELKLTRVVSESQTANRSSRRLLESLNYKIESELERFGARQTLYVYNFNDEN
jgi:ribosomal-protein-alanine N-acetyltransferase